MYLRQSLLCDALYFYANSLAEYCSMKSLEILNIGLISTTSERCNDVICNGVNM